MIVPLRALGKGERHDVAAEVAVRLQAIWRALSQLEAIPAGSIGDFLLPVLITAFGGGAYRIIANLYHTHYRMTCMYCGGWLDTPYLDHVIPRSKGGGDYWTNLLPCCPSCNSRKGAKGLSRKGAKGLSRKGAKGLEEFRQLVRLQLLLESMHFAPEDKARAAAGGAA